MSSYRRADGAFTDYEGWMEALVNALVLAVSAPTDTQAADAARLADRLAASMTENEVELAKLIADWRVRTATASIKPRA